MKSSVVFNHALSDFLFKNRSQAKRYFLQLADVTGLESQSQKKAQLNILMFYTCHLFELFFF